MGCRYKVISCCESLNGAPSACLCVTFFVLQAMVMDYFLVVHLGLAHLIWLAADVLNLILLCTSIYVSRSHLRAGTTSTRTTTAYLGAISWLLINISLAAKMVLIFVKVADQLDEKDSGFMGPNMLKTGVALGSIVFLCLLETQHDALPSDERRRYIEALTGTVAFDLLDTADILEVLFDRGLEEPTTLWDGLGEFILMVATLNLLIPTVPLFTLSKTRYGHNKISLRMVYIHRVVLVLVVNIPNLLVRVILWHGFEVGITPFFLKNVIIITLTLFIFYEHTHEKHNKKHKSDIPMEGVSKVSQEDPDAIDASHDDDTYKRYSSRSGSYDNDFALDSRMVAMI